MSPSPVADAKTLRTATKERAFAPAYYLHGDDDYLKDEELKRVIDAVVDPATRDFNLELLRGADLDAETLGSIVSTPPMMAARRVVVIRDVHALRKDARATLDKYLKNPDPEILLLLVSPGTAKVDAGLMKTTSPVVFHPLTGARIPKWITYYVEHDLGSSITPGAVTMLQEVVGTDLAQLRVELDKLVSFAADEPVNEAAVASVVGVRSGETMGDFLDAVARRDAVHALSILGPVLQQPKASAVTTIMALTTQTLAIGWAQAARDRGTHPAKLSGDLFNLLKEAGGVFTGRSWGEFVATCVRASDVWTPRAIDEALALLLRADACLKDTRLSSDEQLLSTLVLSLCGAPLRQRVA